MKAFILPLLAALPCLLALQIEAQTAAGFGSRKSGYPNAKKHNGILTDAHTKKKQKDRQHILSMLEKQEKQRQARMKATERTTSVTSERLIAESEYDYAEADTILYALGLIDTALFKYSHGRGSEFNYNGMGYETPGSPYAVGYLPTYLLNGNLTTSSDPNYVPGVLYDSMRMWASNIPTYSDPIYSFGYEDSSYEIYGANNNIVYSNDQIEPGMMAPDIIYFNTYDVSNNDISSLAVDYDPAAPGYDTINVTIQIFSGGKLVEDSIADYVAGGVFSPASKWLYSYDASGNLILATEYDYDTGSWADDNRFIMTYNADNTIKTDSESTFDSGWVPNIADSFGYTPSVNYYTYLSTNDYEAYQSEIISKHVGSLGFPDTVFYYQYGNPDFVAPPYLTSQAKYVYTYDSYINPKIVYAYLFNITDSSTGTGYYNATPNGYMYYYYETYTTSAVQNIAATTENIKIYPNPTTNTLNILSTSQPINDLTITNLLGQTLLTGNYNSTQAAVNVADLPAGMYLIRINGTEVRKFAKQ